MPLALELFWQDARYALRGLARNPGFSLAEILAAALGIGAATAVLGSELTHNTLADLLYSR